MELILERYKFNALCTIGELKVDGEPVCAVLEDFDRGLHQNLSDGEINSRKVYAKTCIPYGRYEIVISLSNRFGVMMPLLKDVKGFAGIRIHPGNTDKDTEGCLLPGFDVYENSVGNSRKAYNHLYKMIDVAIRNGEKVFITIKKRTNEESVSKGKDLHR